MSMYHSPSPQCSRFPKVLSPLPPMSNPPNVSVFPPTMSRFVFWLWGAQLKKISFVFFLIEGHPSMTILTLGRWKFRLWGGAVCQLLWWPFNFGGAVCQLLWWPFDFGGGRLTSASPREHFLKNKNTCVLNLYLFYCTHRYPFGVLHSRVYAARCATIEGRIKFQERRRRLATTPHFVI